MVLFRIVAYAPLVIVLIFAIITAIQAHRFRREEYLAARQPPWLKTVFALSTPFVTLVMMPGFAIPLYFWVWVFPKLVEARRELATSAATDELWVWQGRQRYGEQIRFYPGPPETVAAGGRERLGEGDHFTALLFFHEAIRRLHDSYVTNRMASRRPAIEDSQILAGYLSALTDVRERRPDVPTGPTVDGVTGHLLAITAACDEAGHDATPYMSAVQRLRPAA